MSRPVIRAIDVGKNYVLKHQKWDKNRTLRDEIANSVKELFRRQPRDPNFAKTEIFWALKDISLEINEGESVGFVGHNGAGKSTLLKLISRITDPSNGEIEITGRVASLLEVGTGFHAELTGRENIYLKGAIMGMKHSHVRRRFDEIVAFAELERFLDTPVKRYSSGMYVKLGFAVASHLESNILIVDEVLAVGDAHFKRKCIEKMQQILASEGRTILFVSHNMALIRSICQRVISLEKGRIVDDGKTYDVIDRYSKRMEEKTEQNLADRIDRVGDGEIRLIGIEAYSPGEDGLKSVLTTGQPARFVFRVNRTLPGTSCHVFFVDKSEMIVTNFDSSFSSDRDSYAGESDNCVICDVDELPLLHGSYHLEVHLRQGGKLQDSIQGAFRFEVENGTYRGRGVTTLDWVGSVQTEHRWTFPKA